MKFLLIGKYGQLGWELMRTCMTLGEIVAVDYPEVDLQTPTRCVTCSNGQTRYPVKPAAYTAVEKGKVNLKWRVWSMGRPGVLGDKKPAARLSIIPRIMCLTAKGSSYIENDAQPDQRLWRDQTGRRAAGGSRGRHLPIFRTSWVYSLRQDYQQSAQLGKNARGDAHS